MMVTSHTTFMFAWLVTILGMYVETFVKDSDRSWHKSRIWPVWTVCWVVKKWSFRLTDFLFVLSFFTDKRSCVILSSSLMSLSLWSFLQLHFCFVCYWTGFTIPRVWPVIPVSCSKFLLLSLVKQLLYFLPSIPFSISFFPWITSDDILWTTPMMFNIT